MDLARYDQQTREMMRTMMMKAAAVHGKQSRPLYLHNTGATDDDDVKGEHPLYQSSAIADSLDPQRMSTAQVHLGV